MGVYPNINTFLNHIDHLTLHSDLQSTQNKLFIPISSFIIVEILSEEF